MIPTKPRCGLAGVCAAARVHDIAQRMRAKRKVATILEMSDGEVDADVGGLYRTLRRMEEEGSVVSRWCEEGAGPRRREYELTKQGIELAEQWIDALRSRERLDGLLASMLENGLAHLGETGSDGPHDDTGAAPEQKG